MIHLFKYNRPTVVQTAMTPHREAAGRTLQSRRTGSTVTPRAKLRKEAGVVGLLYASVGGIVGSGWLFGPARAAQQAGPLSLGSWIIGAVAVLLLAFVFAELATMIPKSGA